MKETSDADSSLSFTNRGDSQIPEEHIKKGAISAIDMAERFTGAYRKVGLVIHGDFIVGLPGETHESIQQDDRLCQEAR